MLDDFFGLVDMMLHHDGLDGSGGLNGVDGHFDDMLTEPEILVVPPDGDTTGLSTDFTQPPLTVESTAQEWTEASERYANIAPDPAELEVDVLPGSNNQGMSEVLLADAGDIESSSLSSPEEGVAAVDSSEGPVEGYSYGASEGFVAGDWANDATTWHQQESENSCAIACQTDILNSFGLDIEESAVAELAEEKGWYDPITGTHPQALGYVLEEYGIPVTQTYDTPLVEIKDALDDGRKVMVALDANEIWQPETDAWGNPLEQPNAGHAVWVTGIEENSAGDLEVILNDTGHEDGRGSRVALDNFLNAWGDFGRHAAITDISPGGTNVA